MKLIKSLLLASAAGFVATAGANAADLGVKKPSAVEYVKTCPTYGAGFFVVPGTDSCLKLIGRVRFDYASGTAASRNTAPLTRGNDLNVMRVRGYFGFDHRTATEYGLLRTYMRAFLGNDNAANPATTLLGGTGSVAATGATLEYAFIQFGGLTAGRVTPVFEHGWSQFYLGFPTGGMADITYVNSIGYTANFGGGFSATIALDGANEHRSAIISAAPHTYAGQAAPDVVGALAYDQAWGSIKLTGALHQVRVTNAGGSGVFGTEYGYAVGLATKINLPMLSAGSNIWVSGYYAKGATAYAGFTTAAMNIGAYALETNDAIVDAAGIHLTTAYGVSGGIQYFVTKSIALSLGGSYAKHNAFGTAADFQTSSILGQVSWRPVTGLEIGAEAGYRTVSGRGTVAGTDRNDFLGRLRVQRDF